MNPSVTFSAGIKLQQVHSDLLNLDSFMLLMIVKAAVARSKASRETERCIFRS